MKCESLQLENAIKDHEHNALDQHIQQLRYGIRQWNYKPREIHLPHDICIVAKYIIILKYTT